MTGGWKVPPKIKVWEALGAVVDGRVRLTKDGAKVESSDGSKEYTVLWDGQTRAIMTNDNGTYWRGYLGYPAIAFLIVKGEIKVDLRAVESLRGVGWREINAKYRNDYEKTLKEVYELVKRKGGDPEKIEGEVVGVLDQLKAMGLVKLGRRMKPPK